MLFACTPSDVASECVLRQIRTTYVYRYALRRLHEVERSSYPADTCPCCKDEQFLVGISCCGDIRSYPVKALPSLNAHESEKFRVIWNFDLTDMIDIL